MAASFPFFRELKAIFDPRHVFNPGKIIGPAPGMPAWPLRRPVKVALPVAKSRFPALQEPPLTPHSPLLSTTLRWQPAELRAEGAEL